MIWQREIISFTFLKFSKKMSAKGKHDDYKTPANSTKRGLRCGVTKKVTCVEQTTIHVKPVQVDAMIEQAIAEQFARIDLDTEKRAAMPPPAIVAQESEPPPGHSTYGTSYNYTRDFLRTVDDSSLYCIVVTTHDGAEPKVKSVSLPLSDSFYQVTAKRIAGLPQSTQQDLMRRMTSMRESLKEEIAQMIKQKAVTSKQDMSSAIRARLAETFDELIETVFDLTH